MPEGTPTARRSARWQASASSSGSTSNSAAAQSASATTTSRAPDDPSPALMDVDEERLRTSDSMARGLVASADAAAEVVATLDRRHALDGASYVITMMQVGGYRPATLTDFELPKQFGLRQTIGDTLG